VADDEVRDISEEEERKMWTEDTLQAASSEYHLGMENGEDEL
jgi:hypothetical protein